MAFCFIIKAIILMFPGPVLVNTIFVAGGLSAPPRRDAQAEKSIQLCPAALPSHHKPTQFLTWFATWTPQSLQPRVHTVLSTSNGMR